MQNIDLSIIIIEYYSLIEIKECISSFRTSLSGINFEIIISSNSLYDHNQRKMVLKEYNECIWSFNELNGGFAYGMNKGLALAKGRYFIIANPDVKIESGMIPMIQFMDIHQNVGAIGPMIYDEEKNIQDSCREYVTLPRFTLRLFKRVITKKEIVLNSRFDYTKIQTVDWIIGAFIMVRKNVYYKTGGLSERYFMYAEDIDWCKRIRDSGWEIVYFPETKVIYKGSRAARNINKYTLLFIKSHILFWQQYGFIKIYPNRKELTF